MLPREGAKFSQKCPQTLGAQGCYLCGRKEEIGISWEFVRKGQTNIRKTLLFRVLKFRRKPLIALDLSQKGSLNESSIKTRIVTATTDPPTRAIVTLNESSIKTRIVTHGPVPILRLAGSLWMSLPLKQGLWHWSSRFHNSVLISLNESSIKTRIVTKIVKSLL